MRRVWPWLLLYPRGARHNRKLDHFCIKSAEPIVTGANRAIKVVVLSNNHHHGFCGHCCCRLHHGGGIFSAAAKSNNSICQDRELLCQLLRPPDVGGRGEMTEQASRILFCRRARACYSAAFVPSRRAKPDAGSAPPAVQGSGDKSVNVHLDCLWQPRVGRSQG